LSVKPRNVRKFDSRRGKWPGKTFWEKLFIAKLKATAVFNSTALYM